MAVPNGATVNKTAAPSVTGGSPPDVAFGGSGLREPRASHVPPVCVLSQLSNRISCVYEYKHWCLTHNELVNSVMVSAVIDRVFQEQKDAVTLTSTGSRLNFHGIEIKLMAVEGINSTARGITRVIIAQDRCFRLGF